MSPTECFKSCGIPFLGERAGCEKGRGGKKKKGKRKWVNVVESLYLPRRPHEQLAHLGAPRVGAMATTASWSPFPMGMKTPLVVGHKRAWGGGGDVHGPRGPSSFQLLSTTGEQIQHQGPGP